MAKKVGQGIFTRSEPWERYYTEKDGYIYYISEEKNFTADRGWKIMKHEGGNEWVYILTKKKIGCRKYEGEKAYRIYEKLLAKRRRNYDEVLSKGYDTYAVQTLDTSPITVITSPTEESVRYYVEKCNIKDFDMNSATYGLYSNVKIEYNTETGECKILIFNGRTGEIIASYEGVNNDE